MKSPLSQVARGSIRYNRKRGFTAQNREMKGARLTSQLYWRAPESSSPCEDELWSE